jgi:hypothetical protein
MRAFVACVIGFTVIACSDTPTGSRDASLAGRWTGGGACLAVTDEGCNLVAGCGHGQFPPPNVRADGSFDTDGTYRIEAGPISINPAPAAHFSGMLVGSTLRLNVVPTASGLSAMSFTMKPAAPALCTVPCL